MESAAEAGRINVSAYTCDLIRNEFACEYRGKVEVKGKGSLDMYYVTGDKATPA
jgi:class 3 adenylate cyclase